MTAEQLDALWTEILDDTIEAVGATPDPKPES